MSRRRSCDGDKSQVGHQPHRAARGESFCWNPVHKLIIFPPFPTALWQNKLIKGKVVIKTHLPHACVSWPAVPSAVPELPQAGTARDNQPVKGTALPCTAQPTRVRKSAGKVLPKGTRWHLGNGWSHGSVLQDLGSAQRGLFDVMCRETGFPGGSDSLRALSPSIATLPVLRISSSSLG